MHGGIRIGRLFGISIVIDWSWSIIFLFMSWNLTMVFQAMHPTWILGATVLLAAMATLALFGCVLLHELAHSLVARAFGLRVNQIRLLLFGGVSDLEREPKSPGVELLMAIAGPITSIVLGLLVLAMGAVLLVRFDASSVAALGPATTLLLWLGPVNLSLGLFNLVPGLPLDGGRVLRALIWAITKDLRVATKIAALVGRAIGTIFVGAGIAMMLGVRVPLLGSGAGGLWFVVLGWFLGNAARASYAGMLVEQVLSGVRVADLMRRNTWTVPRDSTVAALAGEWFVRSSAHAFPVVDEDGRLVGLVSVGDVKTTPRSEWASTSVSAVMTPRARLVVCVPQEDAHDAIKRLGERDVDQLPVLEGDRLVGMLSRADIARWLELHIASPTGLSTPRHA